MLDLFEVDALSLSSLATNAALWAIMRILIIGHKTHLAMPRLVPDRQRAAMHVSLVAAAKH